MKLVVSGGGTGGHVYPALTIIEALLQDTAGQAMAAADVLWVGSRGGIEEDLVTRAGLAFVGLAAGGLRGMGAAIKARNATRIVTSIAQARRLLRRFKAKAVLSTGGYASVAVTVAAWLSRIPVLIYLPDIVPGQAIRLMSRLADRIAVTAEESARFFRGEKVVATGYPVRPAIFSLDPGEARRALGLSPEAKVVLAFGGSRGARSINEALLAGLPSLLPICEVVHVSGRLDAERVQAAARELPEGLRTRYHPHAYLHNMPQALVAADLAVARAGAATLGEFPAAGLPAILIPYPYSGQHQQPNGNYLARRGAARLLQDSELEGKLVPAILELVNDDETLKAMSQAARALARPDAAHAIARQLRLLADRTTGGSDANP